MLKKVLIATSALILSTSVLAAPEPAPYPTNITPPAKQGDTPGTGSAQVLGNTADKDAKDSKKAKDAKKDPSGTMQDDSDEE